MKKHLFTALFCLGSTALYAQTTLPAGTWQVGGSLNYSQQHGESAGSGFGYSSTTKAFSVNPMVGYLVADNLAVGIDAGYSIGKYQSVDSYSSSSSNRTNKGYYAGLFTEYYRLLGPYFGVKGHLGAAYSHVTSEYAYASPNGNDHTQDTGNGLSANLVPSLLFFPVPKLALGASVGGLYYSYNKSTSSPNVLNNEGSGYNFNAYFGLSQLALSGTFYPGRK